MAGTKWSVDPFASGVDQEDHRPLAVDLGPEIVPGECAREFIAGGDLRIAAPLGVLRDAGRLAGVITPAIVLPGQAPRGGRIQSPRELFTWAPPSCDLSARIPVPVLSMGSE